MVINIKCKYVLINIYFFQYIRPTKKLYENLKLFLREIKISEAVTIIFDVQYQNNNLKRHL